MSQIAISTLPQKFMRKGLVKTPLVPYTRASVRVFKLQMLMRRAPPML
jgi:hypothetical protein